MLRYMYYLSIMDLDLSELLVNLLRRTLKIMLVLDHSLDSPAHLSLLLLLKNLRNSSSLLVMQLRGTLKIMWVLDHSLVLVDLPNLMVQIQKNKENSLHSLDLLLKEMQNLMLVLDHSLVLVDMQKELHIIIMNLQ